MKIDTVGAILALGSGIGIVWPRLGFFTVLLGLTFVIIARLP